MCGLTVTPFTRLSRGCEAGRATGCGTCSGAWPVVDSEDAKSASDLVEYAGQPTGRFWEVHEALMERRSAFSECGFGRIAREALLPNSEKVCTAGLLNIVKGRIFHGFR
jgi:hypothetical protein